MESERGATLTIVVPVYGVEAFLEECLDSVLSYTGHDLQVVAVDDASPDGCPAMLDAYAVRDSRLTVIHLPENRGLSGARNAGLAAATGEYVWFVDSDDWLPDGSVAVVLQALLRTRPDVLVVDHAEVTGPEADAHPASSHVLAGLTDPVRLHECPDLLRIAQSACTKITRRAYLARIELSFSPGWYEDTLYSHRLLMAADAISGVDEVCYCYRLRESGGITTTRSDRHFEVFAQYERLFQGIARDGGVYEEFRPQLFRLMIDHYLVIVGNKARLPSRSRKAFFRRMSADYARWLPADGYPRPGGVPGLKHSLVGGDRYALYVLLRLAYLMVRGLKARLSRRPAAGMLEPPTARRVPRQLMPPDLPAAVSDPMVGHAASRNAQ
ncbi:glycosyltransferase family 2 protein [Hamadaea sp. NPDC051192]|uniref:glycosyltransferase family 2 protein n=1 Tax=Hamadaea sp. NPDC051192 TaxID=3154940 RepID=UPI00342EE41D